MEGPSRFNAAALAETAGGWDPNGHDKAMRVYASVMGAIVLGTSALAQAGGLENGTVCDKPPVLTDHSANMENRASEEAEQAKWFFLIAGVNTYPRLESEELIDRFFNPAMRFFAPSFEDVYTVGDLRDDYLIWPLHVGIGRVVSPRWTVYVVWVGVVGLDGGGVFPPGVPATHRRCPA